MTALRMRQIDYSLEEMIITGMIVDSDFLNRFQDAGKPEYFESDIVSILAEWVQEYGKENNWQAPKEQIKMIYKVKQGEFDEDEAKTVRLFLNKILKEYNKKSFNIGYVAKRAKPYLKKKAFKYLIREADKLLIRDRLPEAENLLENINKQITENIQTWVDIADFALVNTWWKMSRESLIKFPHELGRFLPPILPGKLYTLLAPPKRGKSFWLLYWAYIAALDGLKVVFFSLEMGEEEVHERLSKMISGQSNHIEVEREYTLPVIDCLHNQTGECERAECASPNTVVGQMQNGMFTIDPFEEHPDHIPCTVCKGQDHFIPTSWLEIIVLPTMVKKEIKHQLKQFITHIGGENLKIITYPIGTASPQDIERDLDNLERIGFYGNFMVVDYAQIMKLDKQITDKRNQISDIYFELSRIAKSRNLCTATGSQGNRASATKNRLTVEDIAEDWGIYMIIDAIIAINEQNFGMQEAHHTDHYWNRQRLEVLALRYGKFIYGKQCLVLNDWERAQVNLDSCII